MLDSPIKTKRLRDLLTRLLDIYSPSGKEEEVIDFVYAYLKRRGLPVVRQEVDENRCNLVVAPAGSEAAAAFIGHLDTVPAFDLDEFGFYEEGDRIFGLGASDMKSGCAAMIEAFVTLWEQGYTSLPLILALVVGEEETGDGAAELVKEYHFPWALIGEPTTLQPCLNHYGYMEVQLITRGSRRHASLARPGQNAVEGLLRLLLNLTNHLEKNTPRLVYNIRDLFSSGSGFIVPDECRAWVDIHLPPEAPLPEITMELEELVEGQRLERPDLETLFHIQTLHAGYALPDKGPLTSALKTALAGAGLAWEPASFPSHSDANLLWTSGVKPVMFGCGSLDEAHRPDEFVLFDQVRVAAEIYYRTALSFAAKDAS